MKKILALLFMIFAATNAYAIPPMPSSTPPVGTITGLFTGEGDYLKSDGTKGTPSGSGDVVQSGSPANHYWAYFTADKTVTGVAITASKPVCSDANGNPAVCAGTEGVWQPVNASLTALSGLSSPITVDGNNITVPGALITTAEDGSRVISILNNTSAPSLSANTYGWYFYGEVPYINVDGVSKPAVQKVCKTITNPSDADNVLFHIAAAGTITKISGICVGGTSAVITLQDAGADGSGSTAIDDAITMDTDGANGGTISYAIHDGDIIKLDVGTVTGVVTQLMVCYE